MTGSAQLDRLNDVAHDELIAELRRCFDHEEWADRVARARPFAGVAEFLAAAADAWQSLDEDAWREALRSTAEPAVVGGDDATVAAVRVALDLYRHRFGFGFVAAGGSMNADETLMLIRIRLGHEPPAELRRGRDEYRTRARRCLERAAGVGVADPPQRAS